MTAKIIKSPISIANFDASYSDSGPVYSMPPECFTSEEFYQFELNAVWAHEWFCIGRVNDIPKTGDYYTIEVGEDPLIVIRDRSGSVNVVSNVCQHRGMVIVEGRGNTRRLSCPLHAWVYNTSGELTSAPGLSDEKVEDFNIKDVCLPKIRTEIWEGFIFITFDESLPPLSDRLGNLGDQLSNYKMSELRASEPLKMEVFDWNWKIFNDECYHCSYLHGGSWGEMYPLPQSNVDEMVKFNDVEKGLVSYNLISQHIDAAPTHTGSILQPSIDGLTDQERQQLSYITVAPNLLIVAMPDKVKYFMWLPKGATESWYGVSWMYPESTLALDSYEKNYQQEHDDLWQVMEEDLFAWKGVQKGMQSKYAPRGRLTSHELVIQRLQNWLIDKYRAEEKRADAE
ncbi:aromatic ring-hydroxylating dioxygenase subunit alpha [Amphritea sp. 2_MG-2023]|uniref:aromatic ring-hydroxylating oxygenase subunit alpha n=1 Tax=Amphritea TaxID=515417 RepID=UPI001C06803B|nr:MULTISPECIES: aromatic ring-hydroxylating dioxygenase subunit alpha [Amphritea]MBU2965837.1 aromatic ring-hydroxylating dioxygenase subunit alpha [Amphritea atlantica]MDO6417393.1 aromatic ring-hydroxylating dioxygenase subunit alpha [Amphritea sp. 2_MG-2023]